MFIPSYASSTTEYGSMQSYLTPTLLSKTEKLLQDGDIKREGWMHINSTRTFCLAGLNCHSALVLECPLLKQNQASWWNARERWLDPSGLGCPFAMSITGRGEHLAVLLQLYLLEYADTTGWESFLQIANQLLPQFTETVDEINVNSTTHVYEFSRFFWYFCWMQ